jgi:hypothetical protein
MNAKSRRRQRLVMLSSGQSNERITVEQASTKMGADGNTSVGALLLSFVRIQKADSSKSTELVFATDSRGRYNSSR